MDFQQLEQKMREKSANADEYFAYLSAISEIGDKLKYAQACCCFFDYCIQHDDIPSYVAFSPKIATSQFFYELNTSTSMDLLMQDEDKLDFPMEAILNDFEDKKDILEMCSMGYDPDNPTVFPKPSVCLKSKKSNKFLTKLKLFARGLDLGLTLFGKILFGIFAIFTLVMFFIRWECALIMIPVVIRLFTNTEIRYNKASVWIISLVAASVVWCDISKYPGLFFLIIVPIASVVIAFIKGFSLKKYLIFNIIGFNLIVFLAGSELLVPSICVSAFLLVQCIAENKWQRDWVIDSLSAAAMAGNADTAIVSYSYKRKLQLYYAAQHMPREQKQELFYFPTCFYTMPEKESMGNSKSILMSWLLLLVVIAGGFYIYKCLTSCSTNNQSKISYENTSNNYQDVDKEDYPFTAQRIISESELVSYSKEELLIMRNEIFARHGYTFKRADLKEYFSQKSWYNPQYSNVDKYLSKIEKQNIETIKKAENNRK